MTKTALWQAYSLTKFACGETELFGEQFAIITAWNPLGRLCSEEENRLLDETFERQLPLTTPSIAAFWAGDASMSHKEWSHVINVEKHDAVNLAKLAQQNALYYVEGDALLLLPALLVSASEVNLGSFRERCIGRI